MEKVAAGGRLYTHYGYICVRGVTKNIEECAKKEAQEVILLGFTKNTQVVDIHNAISAIA